VLMLRWRWRTRLSHRNFHSAFRWLVCFRLSSGFSAEFRIPIAHLPHFSVCTNSNSWKEIHIVHLTALAHCHWQEDIVGVWPNPAVRERARTTDPMFSATCTLLCVKAMELRCCLGTLFWAIAREQRLTNRVHYLY
jgi:hypothetical protein